MQQQDALKGKVALVFGGSRGIGEAIVRRLARDGASVALTYVTSPERAAETVRAAEAEGVQALAILADSQDVDAVKGAVEQTLGRFGRLDIVVVNAGILMGGTIDAFSLADFDKMVAINVRGVFAALHFAAPRMEDGGRIITIGSNTAIRTGFAGSSVYSMTKAAVAALVRGVAIDLAPRRITVNNVQPGPTVTDMTAGLVDRVKPLIPLGRLAEPAEIGGLVAYLAGDEAGFVTGASVTIDGGYVA
jgi:3-oxoacyl-[acyl-carrier protein] reductase